MINTFYTDKKLKQNIDFFKNLYCSIRLFSYLKKEIIFFLISELSKLIKFYTKSLIDYTIYDTSVLKLEEINEYIDNTINLIFIEKDEINKRTRQLNLINTDIAICVCILKEWKLELNNEFENIDCFINKEIRKRQHGNK